MKTLHSQAEAPNAAEEAMRPIERAVCKFLDDGKGTA